MVELIVKSLEEIYPFLGLFLLWDFVYALMYKTLGAYEAEV